jgi:uncharacterized protein YjbI with pentapeptide repeats
MAEEEHLYMLKQGAGIWNRWRAECSTVIPDLSGADLRHTNLREANLSEANLVGTDLSGANAEAANLSAGRLSKANLSVANLSGASLPWADLFGGDFDWANLSKADLFGVDLQGANLRGAILSGANLGGGNLSRAILSGADLREADLNGADLTGADLNGADLSRAIVGWTKFSDVDLTGVEGLDELRHLGPSTIGIDTICRSGGRISEIFLRGCGVPDVAIRYMRYLTGGPIWTYSCFISYSSPDQVFAERLHADLQGRGLRCWFTRKDVPIGELIRARMDEGQRTRDKLLVVLSADSMGSTWAELEIKSALEKEAKEKRLVLHPLCLDDALKASDEDWAARLRRERMVADFRGWADAAAYQRAVNRLIRDLGAEQI